MYQVSNCQLVIGLIGVMYNPSLVVVAVESVARDPFFTVPYLEKIIHEIHIFFSRNQNIIFLFHYFFLFLIT